mgnify:CR=1 FL=1
MIFENVKVKLKDYNEKVNFVKNNEILVSIIVPVYNAKKYLSNTLESILKQSYKNLEIILINDGSTDNSKEICEHYAKIDSRIILLNKINGGVSSARNYGLEVAKGDYISFIDSDDYLTVDMIEILVKDVQNTDAEIAVCGYWHITESEYKEKIKELKDVNMNKIEILKKPIEYFYSKKYMPNIWNKIFKKSLIENIRFDNSIYYGEDFLFCALAFMKANIASYRSDKKYFYIKREDGLSMKEGSLDFWNGYVKSKKLLYDKFVEMNANKELLEGIWEEYCVAIMAVYRYVVHKRLVLEYNKTNILYKDIILEFIKKSNIKLSKKLEYFSFVVSYNIAVLCHKRK